MDMYIGQAGDGRAISRYHPRTPRGFKGPRPLETVALHRLHEPEHWHVIGYGLSDLVGKESPDEEWSGWGFELTFRVDGDEEPLWTVDLLTGLANYVISGSHPFGEGHLLDLRGPIRLDTESPITAAMITEDPVLGTFSGPFGWVKFLQVVGLTADELELCRSWSAAGVRDLLSRDDPLLVTRLDRTSIVEGGRWDSEISIGRETEGSSLHELRIATLKLTRTLRRRSVVEMGAGASTALGPALTRELVGVGASFSVVGDSWTLRFTVSEESGWDFDEEGVELRLPLGRVDEASALFDGKLGWHSLDVWPGLWFRIVA